MTMLLIAGIAVLAAGLLAVAFGIPVKEFSFGNTLILAGAVAACTGIILLGLAVVVRELQNIARRLGPANPAACARRGEPQQPVTVVAINRRPQTRMAPSRRRSNPHPLRLRLRGRKGSGRGIAGPAMARPKRPRRSRQPPPSRGAICCSHRHRAGNANARRRRPIRLPPIPLPRQSRRRHRKSLLPPALKMPGRNRTGRGPTHCGAPVRLRRSPSRMPPRPRRSVLRQPCGARSRRR